MRVWGPSYPFAQKDLEGPDRRKLRYLHDVETGYYCPQIFQSLGFLYGDVVSE